MKDIIKLTVLAVLSIYLYAKRRKRVGQLPAPVPPAGWTGKGIDVTPLRPSVENARRDYRASRRSVRNNFLRRRLVAFARRGVARLGFFHDRETNGTG